MESDDIMTILQCARKLGRSYTYVDDLIRAGLLHVTSMSEKGHKCVSFAEARDAQAQHDNTPEGYMRRTEAAEKLGICVRSLIRYADLHGIRRKKAYEQRHIVYVFNADDVYTIASGKAKNLKHTEAALSADELRAKRLRSDRIMRMHKYALQQYAERAQHKQQQYEKNTILPLRVQAQKDAIREALAKLKQQKEKQ
jgi:hypothetical protein